MSASHDTLFCAEVEGGMNREMSNTGWIVGLLIALLCVVGLAALVSFSAHGADIQQAAADTSLIQQVLDKAKAILDAYGWSLAGVFVSPFIVFRAVQYAKGAAKASGSHLNRYAMDCVSTGAVFALSYLFLRQNQTEFTQNLLIAGVIAALHTVIIKAVFKFAPERLSSVLTDGVYVDDATTFSKTVLAAVVGKRGDQRSEPRA